jgi:porin
MSIPWILFLVLTAGETPIPGPPGAVVVEANDDLPPLPTPGPIARPPRTPDQPPEDGAPARGETAISANPAAVNIVAGTGALGRLLGFDADSGIRLGGLWIGDASGIMAGGAKPGQWGLNSLTVFDLNLDGEKLLGWKGGMIGTEFLPFSGQPTNSLAGAFPGFDSLQVTPPLVRQELYQLWVRQAFFDDRLIFRIGKTVPTFDFNNVVRPVPVDEPAAAIPAVSGLSYTPVFVNPTLLGAIPGYYNSATGLTAAFAPTKKLYLSYGVYDGNVALGHQTGLEGPRFDGHYFHIGEVGYAYRAGSEKKPGNFGVGLWGQTGPLRDFDGQPVRNTGGVYLFGSQRLWFRNPGQDNSGISGFYQFGANNSNAMAARQFVGAGLTAFGLVPGRPDDSFGGGLAQTWLNGEPGAAQALFPQPLPNHSRLRPSQLMLASYYQLKLVDGWFLQPNLTYIPTPAESSSTPQALAFTIRLTVLF